MASLGFFAKIAAGFAAGYQLLELVRDRSILLRPPGAQDEAAFLSKCIRCGKCAAVCPYHVVKMAAAHSGESVGTPYLAMRDGACRLCEDFPCVAACPSGALSNVSARSDVRIGIAQLDRDLCIALKGMRCEVCYRSCPLINEAITLKYSLREGDATHAIFEPVVNPDVCVGCGICEERCVISDPAVAIRIVPRPYET
jgi:ferredoxin-type protein NapG